MSQNTRLAILGVRICALLIAGLGIWQMLGNIAGSFRDVDPSYLAYYFQSQLARPLCAVATGLILAALSRPLGRLLARGLD